MALLKHLTHRDCSQMPSLSLGSNTNFTLLRIYLSSVGKRRNGRDICRRKHKIKTDKCFKFWLRCLAMPGCGTIQQPTDSF